MSKPKNKRQVRVEIVGQLGNQMFQYAAGRALAERLAADLIIVRRRSKRYGLGRWLLEPFDLDVDVREPEPESQTRLQRRVQRFQDYNRPQKGRRSGIPVTTELDMASIDEFFAIDEDCFLIGTWEAPIYFASVADQVRSEFTLDRFAGPSIADALSRIDDGPTVAIHVRRIRGPKYKLIEREFYDRARKLLDRSDPNLRYCVFSDHPQEARALLDGWQGCEFVEGNSFYEDQFLMSRCRHYIIPDSTFSWWAAWLGAGADSLVLAPRWWLTRKMARGSHLPDPYPEGWILL